ncbi:hypothetical protein GCM10010300_46860 [Streptomyces olivaceoviridis]|uniref:YbfB/YjiJ family MFS transporter n=1 Tax=Streptomyces olivaceoviridis TaxID=1921 RepID=UPI00198850BC|nr:YbfB/YjiJ family MFS transporter [Streptomyces olivaceoviridis]GGY97499.1 hypothetical protein GCM10010300_46860 [Streptomyces olivaceoviridis]
MSRARLRERAVHLGPAFLQQERAQDGRRDLAAGHSQDEAWQVGGVGVAAQSTRVLVVGLVVAGMASGFSWAPFSDTADRLLPDRTRERVMALVPSGTNFGVTVAGPLALVARGANWRYAWIGFALVAFAMARYAARILPAGRHRGDAGGTGGGHAVTARWFLGPAAVPLYVTAFVYGVIGAFYWAFALEAVSDAAGEDSPVAPLFWTLMGLAGLSGVFAGAFFLRLGLRLGQAALFLALSAAITLLGLAPDALGPVIASAVLYGPALMVTSSPLALWSYRVFPEQPSTGFSATVPARAGDTDGARHARRGGGPLQPASRFPRGCGRGTDHPGFPAPRAAVGGRCDTWAGGGSRCPRTVRFPRSAERA